MLISADYSQIELRVLAHAAGEPVLAEIFRRGEDVHTATASQVFAVDAAEIDHGMRSKAKMINFGIVYGLSDFGLADRLNIPREEAKAFIDAYRERFPRVAALHGRDDRARAQRGLRDDAVGTAPPDPRAAGAQLPGPYARRAPRRQHRDPGDGRRHHQARDGPRAATRSRAPGCETRLILTIHDELLFEGPPAETAAARELIEREMCGVWEREPPLAVEIGVGQNWLEAK